MDLPARKITTVNARSEGPAWKAARDMGIDMALIEDSLQMSPWERIVEHQRALNRVLMLESAAQQMHEKR